MRFKTTPMLHQQRGFDLLKGKEGFALLCEQGTGKTKIVIDDAARCWGEGLIDAMLVLAPNGVHTKWVTIEVPKHMPDWCTYVSAFFSAGSNKKHNATIEKLFDKTPDGDARPLRILTMNYEALATAEGLKLADRFSQTFEAMCVVDESQRIKNPKAVRTLKLMKMRRRFPRRRILSGTPVTKSPFDIFSQFYFLDPTILRTDSYTAFKSEYAEMLPDNHHLVKKLQGGAWKNKDGTPSRRVPQIVARDAGGMPEYRNLDKLQRLIAAHSYRVLKKDCLDLPEKIYDTIPFEMTARQAEVYARMDKEKRADLMRVVEHVEREGKMKGLTLEESLIAGRELIVASKLGAMVKLQQITCGYLKLEDGAVIRMFKKVMDNPRNQVLMDSIEDCEGSIIVWAPHRDKINQIIECLREGYEASQILRYDGGVNKAERMQAVDDFQSGKSKFFVGNPASGGTGLTLTAAETSYYYSNSFDLEHRLQSEDRNHRIGTTGHVRYFDLEAIGTIDRRIVESNQMKKTIADAITGDDKL